jgi:hypothetical protein
MLRKLLLFVFLSCGLFACSSEQSTIALNWFTRIDHAPGCGDKNVALITGNDTLLCPLYRAIFSGDSLVAKSEGKCYFIDLQDITRYNSIDDLEEIDCADFDQFIKNGTAAWPKQGIYDQRVE